MEEKMARGAGGGGRFFEGGTEGGDIGDIRSARQPSTGHLQKALNLREGLGIDSWRGRFT